MVTQYPAAIDTNITLQPITDGKPVTGSSVDQLRVAIIAIESQLGVKPSATYATVRARLDTIEGLVGNLKIIELQKDLGGTLENPEVIGIYGRPISSVAPTVGEVLIWDGIAWSPGNQPAVVNFGGDLTGNPLSQKVIGLQNRPISSTAPTTNQVLTWNGTSWAPAAGGGGGGVVIFDGGSPVQNLTTIKTNQTATDSTKNGIINFGADTTGLTTGVTSSFATLLGGDQNVITNDTLPAHSSFINYSTIVGGRNNTISAVESFIGGGFNHSISGGEGNSFPVGNSILGGYNNQIIFCAGAVITGGLLNTINNAGQDGAFIGSGRSNTINIVSNTSNTAVIAGGTSNTITDGPQAVIGGGNSNFVQAQNGTIGGGSSNTVTGQFGTIPGGADNTASGTNSFACGIAANAIRNSQWAYSGSGVFASLGDQPQYSKYFVKGISTSGSAAVLSSDLFTPTNFNLVNGVAYIIRATCVANRTDAAGRAAFIHTILAHASSGAATIDSDTTTASIPNGTAWTIAFSTSGADIRATFTGTAGQTVKATVLYEFVELPGGL
jgi:hypothetical protein